MESHRIPSGEFSAAERSRLLAENERLRQALRERHRFLGLAGGSRAIRDVRDRIAQVAPSPGSVLLRGEVGAGKTRAARAIHDASKRSAGPFVTLCCAAMPDVELDAQLFGLARADGGTLFLDEVADLGPRAQARLLALLREGALTGPDGLRLGDHVRLVVATAAPLEELVASGSFDAELFTHLSLVTIRIPPLRERKTDLPELADLFVERAAREHVRRVNRLSVRAMDLLMHYDWPGNVGELRRTIEQAVVLTAGPVIHHHHLPNAVQRAGVAEFRPLSLSDAIDVYEKDLLEDALRRTQGVRSDAARLLLTSERVLNYRLRKHRIDARRYKVAG